MLNEKVYANKLNLHSEGFRSGPHDQSLADDKGVVTISEVLELISHQRLHIMTPTQKPFSKQWHCTTPGRIARDLREKQAPQSGLLFRLVG